MKNEQIKKRIAIFLGTALASGLQPSQAYEKNNHDPSAIDGVWFQTLGILSQKTPDDLVTKNPSDLVQEPLKDPKASLPPLREAHDSQLQRELEKRLKRADIARAIREQRFAAALVDITDVTAPRLAMINGDLMVYAASLPKIAILLGVFEQAQRGELTTDTALMNKATRMIRNSSNSAASDLYLMIGPPRLAEILSSDRYRLYDKHYGGGLWVGKPYARKKTWRRDPLANLSHGATAFQVARFFYLLQSGQLVSPESSKQMKAILGSPAIQHKFVKGLRKHRPGSKVFRKSGTWRTYHSDAGIVERNGRSYIAVILSNDPAGSSWLSELIVVFDDLIHKPMRPDNKEITLEKTEPLL